MNCGVARLKQQIDLNFDILIDAEFRPFRNLKTDRAIESIISSRKIFTFRSYNLFFVGVFCEFLTDIFLALEHSR